MLEDGSQPPEGRSIGESKMYTNSEIREARCEATERKLHKGKLMAVANSQRYQELYEQVGKLTEAECRMLTAYADADPGYRAYERQAREQYDRTLGRFDALLMQDCK